MNSSMLAKRTTIPIRFSQELEYRLLKLNTPHLSLTHDLELAAYKGLELLEELEDVRDITHLAQIQKLIGETNRCRQAQSKEFQRWHIALSEDLLDEVDLLLITHGEDLTAIGLKELSRDSIIVLLVVAGLYHPDFKPHQTH
jgi:hypothetical protein